MNPTPRPHQASQAAEPDGWLLRSDHRGRWPAAAVLGVGRSSVTRAFEEFDQTAQEAPLTNPHQHQQVLMAELRTKPPTEQVGPQAIGAPWGPGTEGTQGGDPSMHIEHSAGVAR